MAQHLFIRDLNQLLAFKAGITLRQRLNRKLNSPVGFNLRASKIRGRVARNISFMGLAMPLPFPIIKINAEGFCAAGPLLMNLFPGMLRFLFTRCHRDAAFRLRIGGFPRQAHFSKSFLYLL
ncbi:hypothetical protein HmCmsJML008_04792 [Escherichia coli]|nr:hypothetical protein HmCmsJML008_04792 [Escherichia coli]